MFYVRSWANSQTSLCIYCMLQPLEDCDWVIRNKHELMHSSVQQYYTNHCPLINIQPYNVQAIIKSIQNLVYQHYCFLFTALTVTFQWNNLVNSPCQLIVIQHVYISFTVMAKTLYQDFSVIQDYWGVYLGLNGDFSVTEFLCNRLTNSTKPSWHFM